MPSTIGHAIAGATVAWAADIFRFRGVDRLGSDLRPSPDAPFSDADPAPTPEFRPEGSEPERPTRVRLRAKSSLTLVCAAVAAAPDLDLLFHTHRTYTHSVGAMIFVALFAAALAANARRPIVATALTVAAAYGSHLLLDWMAVDRTFPYGIQALWPFDSGWYISGWDVFRQTVRRQFLSPHSIQQNLLAVGQEIAILGPIAWAVWSVRVKTLAGLPAELPGGDHSTE